MRTLIKDVKAHDGEIVEICGFVKQVRDKKTMQFAVIRDVTEAVQLTLEKNEQNEAINKIISSLTVESSVKVTGKVHVDDFVKLNGVEIWPTKVEIANLADNFLPIDMTDFNETNRDKRLDWRFLDLRSKEHQLIFRTQTVAEMAMREFWLGHGFTEIHSPKLVGNPSESGAELFELEYFDRKAYLAQSPQFYKQMGIAAGFEKVFEIGPVFRANKSSTTRHDTEFTSVDCEFAWIDSFEDVMKMEEEWLHYVIRSVKEKLGDEIKAVFGRDVAVPALPFPRVTMEEAKAIVKARATSTPRPKNCSANTRKKSSGTSLFSLPNFPPPFVRSIICINPPTPPKRSATICCGTGWKLPRARNASTASIISCAKASKKACCPKTCSAPTARWISTRCPKACSRTSACSATVARRTAATGSALRACS